MNELEPMRDCCIPDEASSRGTQYDINRYIFASKFVEGKTVVDVACGVGYGSSYLGRKGAREVIGGDIAKDTIEYARAHYPRKELYFVQIDATSLPFPDACFDVVVSFETIEHLRDYRRFLFECGRVLKRGGLFICSTPNRRRFPLQPAKPLNPFHVQEFYIGEFEDLVKEYFTEVSLFYQAQTLNGFINSFIIPLVGRLLSALPKGEYIKEVIKGIIHCDTPYVKPGAEILDEQIDKKYTVLPFEEKHFRLPFAIIAVAKKKH